MVSVIRSEARYWSLHTHSRYSFNDALPSVKDLVAAAKRLRYRGLGLTDHGNMAGSLQLYAECQKAGIKPFPGTEFYVVYDRGDAKAKRYHACITAYTETGYRNLIAFNTAAHRNFRYKPLLDMADLAQAYEAGKTEGLAITTGCHFGMPIQAYVTRGYEAARGIVASYASWFPGSAFVELQNHHVQDNEISDEEASEAMASIADELGLPVIITQDSHYIQSSERALHDTLKQLVAYGDDPGEATFPGDGYHMVNDAWMKAHHPKYYERGIEGLELLLEYHTLSIPELDTYSYRMPSLSADPVRDLRERVMKALADRGLNSKKYLARAHTELEIVEHTGTSGYLLLVARVTDFCREKEIFFQARGSASGSLLCYLLGITAVDPIKWKLLMERFLSKDRTKPPDVDLDVEHDRRHEVMAMLEQEFSTLQIGTWGTYSLSGEHDKGSLRVKAISRRRKQGLSPEWTDFTEEEKKEIYALSDLNLISSAGVHAAGVLVTTTRTEMEHLVPMMYVASSKTMVSQYDMKEVERIGMVKLDVLGLKTLSVLRRTVLSIGRDPREGLDFIPLKDSATYTWIGNGHTAGVFQLEGWTATKGVKELKPNKIHDVVAAMALYRPAAMGSKATDAYLRRRRGEQPVPKRHEIIDRHTGSTYGVLLYQEQVIAVLRDLGMPPDDLTNFLKAVKASNGNVADAKIVILDLLEPIRALCDAVGMTEADVSWLADALVAYANYGFNQAHATMYGLTAYRCAWLARHHPAEFFAALLSVYSGDPEKEAIYRQAARAAGVRFKPVDVNASKDGYTVEDGAIRRGLEGIKHVGKKAAQVIAQNQPYQNFADFCARVDARAVSGVKQFRAKTKTPPSTLDELRQAEPVGVVGHLLEAGAFRTILGRE